MVSAGKTNRIENDNEDDVLPSPEPAEKLKMEFVAPTPGDRLSLNEYLPYRLARAAERITMGFARYYGSHYGLNRPEWRCIALLGENGELSAAEVAERADLHRTQVSRAVSALENRMWLTRVPDPADRRSERLELTRKGTRVYEELIQAARLYEGKLCRALGDDAVKGLRDGLSAIEDFKGVD